MAKATRPHVLEAEEIQQLMCKAAVRERAMLYLMFKCALRIGEVVQLKLDDVDLTGGYVHVPEGGKTGYRKVKLPDHSDLYHALDAWLAERPYSRDGWLFPTRAGDTHVHGNDLRRHLRNWSGELWGWERPGVPKRRIHPHLYRHTWATDAIARGASLLGVQAVLGHKRLSTTVNTYAHAIERHGDEVMREWKE